ncbi:hypothetical protein O9992_17610 [Vibrio lentus]|nr:hypothetical protein [Vibrio lentus]
MSPQEYLPDSFIPLIWVLLLSSMTKLDHQYTSEETSPVVVNALAALKSAMRQYTKNLSVVSLQLNNWRNLYGHTQETQHSTPEPTATTSRTCATEIGWLDFEQIENAALVESRDGSISH